MNEEDYIVTNKVIKRIRAICAIILTAVIILGTILTMYSSISKQDETAEPIDIIQTEGNI